MILDVLVDNRTICNSWRRRQRCREKFHLRSFLLLNGQGGSQLRLSATGWYRGIMLMRDIHNIIRTWHPENKEFCFNKNEYVS